MSRNLSIDTINGRERVVRRFLDFTNEMPWLWTHQHVDEYFGDLRAIKHRSQNTVRGYQSALELFCAYLVDPVYGWGPRCEELFGTYPVQVCFEWNTATHTQQNEQDPTKRAFTHEELQAFFDHADAEVGRIRDVGRKGWLPALRDATLFKTAYAFGLRNREVRHLRTIDFERNPHAREFGVRLALGARPARLLGRALWRAARLGVIGAALGIAAALGAAAWIGDALYTVPGAHNGVLFKVRTTDPVVLGTAAVGVILIALVAGAVPARRLATLDPVTVLRQE